MKMRNFILGFLVILVHLPLFAQKNLSWCLVGTDTLYYKRTSKNARILSSVLSTSTNSVQQIEALENGLEERRVKVLAGQKIGNSYILRYGFINNDPGKYREYIKEADFYIRYESQYEQMEYRQAQQKRDSVIRARSQARETQYRLEEREKFVKDSISSAQYRRELFVRDSIEDLRYSYVSASKLYLRRSPSSNAKADIYLCKGFKVEIIKKLPGEWCEVMVFNVYIPGVGRVDGAQGYVNAKFLVSNKASIPFSDQDECRESFGTVDAVKLEPLNSGGSNSNGSMSGSGGKSGRHYDGHTYIRGSRGGCYYINENGKKVYVDRSLCN